MGQRVRAARRAKGYTIEKLAERAELAPQYLSEVERGIKVLGSEKLRAVSLALGRSTDYFIHGVGDAGAERANVLEEVVSLSPVDREQVVRVLEGALRVVKSAGENRLQVN